MRRYTHHHRGSSRASRPGIATVEFVMALPVLLFLFAAIISTAYLGLGRIQVAIETRSKAWKQRDQASPGTPLTFGQQEPILERGSKQVKMIPVITGPRITANSHHAVLGGGSWDYKVLQPCEEPFKTLGQMAQGTLAGGLPSLGDLFPNSFNSAVSALGNLGSLAGQGQDGLNRIQQGRDKINQAVDKARQRVDKMKSDTEDKIKKTEQQLEQIKQKLDDLKQKRTEAEKIKDNQKRQKALRDITEQTQALQRQQQQLNRDLVPLRRLLQQLKTAESQLRSLP